MKAGASSSSISRSSTRTCSRCPGSYHDQQSSGEAQLTFQNDLVKAVGGVFYMDSTACGDYNASIGTLSGTLPPTVAPPYGLYITELVEAVISPRARPSTATPPGS